MDRQAVEARIRQIVADALGVPVAQLSEGLERDGHDWESVTNLNIILAAEVEFSRQFTPEEMETMHSVPRIVDVLMQPPAA